MSRPTELPSLAIIMPACNEAENIVAAVEEALQAAAGVTPDYEVIVVDDGSSDATAELVEALQSHHPPLRLLRHRTNQGYGAALRSGLRVAAKEWLFITDADRQFDLAEIENLVAAVPAADLVIGVRHPRRDPLLRRCYARCWGWLVSLLFGRVGSDINCAFKLLRRGVMVKLGGSFISAGATFSAELLLRARRGGFSIREVPLCGHRPRSAGTPSGARPAVILRALLELVRLRLAL